MATGKVDFFNDTGGYGFIETDDADDDVFFHMEDVGGPDLEEGQEVEFEIEESDKGPRDEPHPTVIGRRRRPRTALEMCSAYITRTSNGAVECGGTDRV